MRAPSPEQGPGRNVLGGTLEPCSLDPVTGFTRSGRCDCHPLDVGQHFVCVVMTEDFLAYSRKAGNDLSTPVPEHDFPGLKPGDRWCLCAPRWNEALDAGAAPKVILAATHEAALETCTLEELMEHEHGPEADVG